MNQVEPFPLWIGHKGDWTDFRRVFDLGIEALIQLAAEELPPQSPRNLICCHFPLLDGTGNRATVLSLAIHIVATLIKNHVPTLIACGAGMSRSPAIAAVGLAVAHQESPEKWLKRVVECHPSDVSPGFWSEITGILSTDHGPLMS
jgi:protein-tyrosine phosphatase